MAAWKTPKATPAPKAVSKNKSKRSKSGRKILLTEILSPITKLVQILLFLVFVFGALYSFLLFFVYLPFIENDANFNGIFGFLPSDPASVPSIIYQHYSLIEWFHIEVENYSIELFGRYNKEFIFLTPIILFIVQTITTLKLNDAFNGFLGLWSGLSFFYGLSYFFASGQSFLHALILIFPAYYMTKELDSTYKPGQGYSTKKSVLGLKIGVRQLSNFRYSMSYLRSSLALVLLLSFWWSVKINNEAVREIFMVLISSSLFVIGFLALIFTYAFEKMKSVRVRETIQSETNAIYRVVGIVIAFSLMGLVALPMEGVHLTFYGFPDKSTLNTAAFLVALVGTVFSIEATIHVFTKTAEDLLDQHEVAGERLMLFDEINQVPDLSINSYHDAGGLTFKSHLLEKGFKVLSYDEVSSSGILRANPDYIVLPRVTTVISEKLIKFYRQLVESGRTLIVFIDTNDFEGKKSLLTEFDIDPEKCKPFTISGNLGIVPKVKSGSSLAEFTLSGGPVVGFNVQNNYKSLAEFSVLSDSGGAATERFDICILSTVGKGTVVFIGNHSGIENSNIDSNDSKEFFYYIIDRLDQLRSSQDGIVSNEITEML